MIVWVLIVTFATGTGGGHPVIIDGFKSQGACSTAGAGVLKMRGALDARCIGR